MCSTVLFYDSIYKMNIRSIGTPLERATQSIIWHRSHTHNQQQNHYRSVQLWFIRITFGTGSAGLPVYSRI